jgi:hypothetical protein
MKTLNRIIQRSAVSQLGATITMFFLSIGIGIVGLAALEEPKNREVWRIAPLVLVFTFSGRLIDLKQKGEKQEL